MAAPRVAAPRPGYHAFARIVAAATFLLIIAGALVTSTGSGLSVPDWPLSFGTLFPHMVGGVRFEHTHRLIAGTVAILTVVLCVWVVRKEERSWVRTLAVAAVAAVVAQALLGGLTVLMKLPTAVSAAHGTLAQTFFCLVVALAMVTSPSWHRAQRRPLDARARRLRAMALATTACIWAQLVIGAVMRHEGAGLAIARFPLSDNGTLIPLVWNRFIAINFAHRSWALVVFVMVMATASYVLTAFRDYAEMRGPAIRLAVLVVIQVALGAATVWSAKQPIPTSLHVANGALVLVTSLVVTLWAWRLFAPVPGEAR